MSKEKFETSSLDVILSDADEIQEVAEQQSDISSQTPMLIGTQNQATVDVVRVYNELSNLLSTGNNLLESAKYAVDQDPTQEGILTGAAALLSTIKDVMKEFTKVHLQNIKFEQAKQLQLLKHNDRKDLVELKNTLDKTAQELPKDALAYTQEDIVRQIIESQEFLPKQIED